MNSFDEFKMGDALWEYLKSKRSRSWFAEQDKAADVAAEAREESGAGQWESFNQWDDGRE